MSLLDAGQFRVVPVQLALRIGSDEASFIYQLDQWLRYHRNQGNPKIREGREWYYSTYENWVADFPYWSLSKVRRVIKSCEEQGVLLSSNYNRIRDRTKWYAIEYDHALLQAVPSAHNEQDTTHNGSIEVSIMDSSYQEITPIDNTIDITVATPTVEDIVNATQPGEDEVMERLKPSNGVSLSIWWRRVLKIHGHSKGLLPALTIKQQGLLKQLMKKLGDEGPVQVNNALKNWEAFGKHVQSGFGAAVVDPKNIQRFIQHADALSQFEPPKEFVPSDTPEKSLSETVGELGHGPKAQNPDLEL